MLALLELVPPVRHEPTAVSFFEALTSCLHFFYNQIVVQEYPFGTQLHRDKCMMHQMSKVVIEIVHFYFSFALTSVLHFVLFFC